MAKPLAIVIHRATCLRCGFIVSAVSQAACDAEALEHDVAVHTAMPKDCM